MNPFVAATGGMSSVAEGGIGNISKKKLIGSLGRKREQTTQNTHKNKIKEIAAVFSNEQRTAVNSIGCSL